MPLLNKDDADYPAAVAVWGQLEQGRDRPVTTNYVVLETIVLLQSRIGLTAVRDFAENIVPLLDVEWVNRDIHDAAVARLLRANRRQLSLVDCVSFEVMRAVGVRRAFAFDPHFAQQGFECLPLATQ